MNFIQFVKEIVYVNSENKQNLSNALESRIKRFSLLFSIILCVLILVAPNAFAKDCTTSGIRTAFGKETIQSSIEKGQLQNVYYKGNYLMPKKGYKFKKLTVSLPDGTRTARFQLFDNRGNFADIEVACSCDGFSSSGACTQIGSSPFGGILCGGACGGCEAFVLF